MGSGLKGGFPMKVRPATSEDAVRCAEISTFRPAEKLKDFLGDPHTRWLLIEDDQGSVVGVGIIHLWEWNGIAWIWDIVIDEKERKKGYGRNLLSGMIEAAREMGARVLMDFGTPRAGECEVADLYLKSGFRVCGSNDRWFKDTKDSTALFYGYDL
jgi:GNAT superfamily N-acetyltransferase